MADVAGKQGLDAGALIPQVIEREMVESLSTWIPMPWHVLDDVGFMALTWERIDLLRGLPEPSPWDRIRGWQEATGKSGTVHRYNVGWRRWLAAQRYEWSRRLDVKQHARQWLHDRYFGDLCPERED